MPQQIDMIIFVWERDEEEKITKNKIKRYDGNKTDGWVAEYEDTEHRVEIIKLNNVWRPESHKKNKQTRTHIHIELDSRILARNPLHLIVYCISITYTFSCSWAI